MQTLVVTLALAVLCAVPCSLIAAPTLEQIDRYQKKMLSYSEDLVNIAEKMINGNDQQIALNLESIASEYSDKLGHIYDLLVINALVHNPADKKRIKPIISNGINSVAKRTDLSIRHINGFIALLKNQGVIVEATKLRDDLRALKELLASSD